MKNLKKIIALVLVIIAVASCFVMPASAAKTSNQKIVKWSCVTPSKATANQVTYTIKGNLLTQKKVTVVASSTSLSFNYDSKSINFYKNNARFKVDIYKNGVWQRGYTGTLGQHFYLPRGTSNYTVVLKTYYNNWNGNNSTCWTAAAGGSCYFLKAR